MDNKQSHNIIISPKKTFSELHGFYSKCLAINLSY